MTALTIIAIGILATAVMTVFMNTCALIMRRNLYTVEILTQMLGTWIRSISGKRSIAKLLAVVVHYSIGVVFVLAYYLLRSSNGYTGNTSSYEPWTIGTLYGLLAIAGWSVFVRIHPAPPPTVPWEYYLLCIFTGHLIFTATMIWSFNFFSQT